MLACSTSGSENVALVHPGPVIEETRQSRPVLVAHIAVGEYDILGDLSSALRTVHRRVKNVIEESVPLLEHRAAEKPEPGTRIFGCRSGSTRGGILSTGRDLDGLQRCCGAGFNPGTSYGLEQWDTYVPGGAVVATETLVANSVGNLRIPIRSHRASRHHSTIRVSGN